MEQVIAVLNSLVPIITVLVGTGLVVKYVPVKILAAIPNAVIPFLNALLAFFTAFGPAPAEASVFGVVMGKLSVGAKAVGALAISAVATVIYETYMRPILDKLGVKPNS